MPVLNKEIELDDGSKILVRQASGMEKMPFESILAKAFRKYRHFGFDQSKWTEEQMEDFMSYTEELGGSMQEQVRPLWTYRKSSPVALFLLQGGSPFRPHRQVRGDGRMETTGVRPCRIGRDSRPNQGVYRRLQEQERCCYGVSQETKKGEAQG